MLCQFTSTVTGWVSAPGSFFCSITKKRGPRPQTPRFFSGVNLYFLNVQSAVLTSSCFALIADEGVRVPIMQHRQRDLPHKARPADEEDLLALKYFCW